MNSRSGQVFVQDLVVALLIIVMVIIIFFSFEANNDKVGESIEEDMSLDSKTISDYLMSSGYPENWNITSATRIGITNDDNVINSTKLSNFYNFTLTDYSKTKTLFKTNYDYVVFFIDNKGNIRNMSSSVFFGKPGINSTNIEDENPKYLSKISRFLVLKTINETVTSEILEMRIYVWKKE